MKIKMVDYVQAQQTGYTVKCFNEIIEGERYMEDNNILEATVSFTFSYGYQFKFKTPKEETKMEEIKSKDYLDELVAENGKSGTIDILEKVSYLLADNGYQDARWFIDDIIESLE